MQVQKVPPGINFWESLQENSDAFLCGDSGSFFCGLRNSGFLTDELITCGVDVDKRKRNKTHLNESVNYLLNDHIPHG